mgnify:CR=1 FL=1
MSTKTPSPTAKNFYDTWDSIISAWFKDEHELDKLLDKKQSLSIRHIPEPYYGDVDECSIVIINLNPGTGLCEQCWLEKNNPSTFVNYIMNNTYSSAARDFPLDGSPSPVPMPQASLSWWESRLLWIDWILALKLGIDENKKPRTKKKPFAIELVPLHSKSFKVADAAEYVNDKYADLLPIIEYAIGVSDSKMGLAIGKPICETLLKNGYQTIPDGGSIQRPLQDVAVGKERYYCIIKGPQGGKILCTWSSGSNKAPAKVFKDYERDVLMPLI